jgi:hypothetical protein
MKKITEYKTEIRTDDEFHQWKSTWDRQSTLPKNVIDYLHRVVFPIMMNDANNTINELNKLKNENKRID